MHDSKVGFGFENCERRSPDPAAENPHLKDWTDSNGKSRASPKDYEGSLIIIGIAVVAVLVVIVAGYVRAVL
jgi:hypothetical protein